MAIPIAPSSPPAHRRPHLAMRPWGRRDRATCRPPLGCYRRPKACVPELGKLSCQAEAVGIIVEKVENSWYVLPSNACRLEFVMFIGFEMLTCKVYKLMDKAEILGNCSSKSSEHGDIMGDPEMAVLVGTMIWKTWKAARALRSHLVPCCRSTGQRWLHSWGAKLSSPKLKRIQNRFSALIALWINICCMIYEYYIYDMIYTYSMILYIYKETVHDQLSHQPSRAIRTTTSQARELHTKAQASQQDVLLSIEGLL